MRWFWYFLIYSFFGFILEVLFARAIRSEKPDRKCFLLLPLCPVYGLGAMGILAVTAPLSRWPLLVALAGAAAATAAEYLMGVFYERALGVAFWDYSGLPLNIGGKVCLPFSAAWGVLALGLVYLVHPAVVQLTQDIPAALIPAAGVVLLADGAVSAYLLRTTGTTECLKWYAGGTQAP